MFFLLLVCRGVFAIHRLDIPANYISHMRPLPKDEEKPLVLNCSVFLRIVKISEAEQQITLELSLKLFWFDKNIKIKESVTKFDGGEKKYIVMPGDARFSKKIWLPDIFIDQSLNLRVANFHTKPASIRVYNDSKIGYNSRFNIDVACPMDFAKYPVDRQICQVKFQSYIYLTSQLNMSWVESDFGEKKLAQFDHDVYPMEIHDEEFAAAKLLIHLERLINYHILQTYIPSILFVILGYTSLYIPAEVVPGRVALGMLTFLALTKLNTSVKDGLPKVSYMTYIDFWVVCCLVSVFSTNLLSIVEILLLKSGKELVRMKFNRVCKIIIPLFFVVFNAIYWPVILTEYFKDKRGRGFHEEEE